MTVTIDAGKKAAIDSALAAATADTQHVSAIKLNARRTALINALTTLDDAGLIQAIAGRYPSLNGDAIKAVTDIYLVLIAVIRS